MRNRKGYIKTRRSRDTRKRIPKIFLAGSIIKMYNGTWFAVEGRDGVHHIGYRCNRDEGCSIVGPSSERQANFYEHYSNDRSMRLVMEEYLQAKIEKSGCAKRNQCVYSCLTLFIINIKKYIKNGFYNPH